MQIFIYLCLFPYAVCLSVCSLLFLGIQLDKHLVKHLRSISRYINSGLWGVQYAVLLDEESYIGRGEAESFAESNITFLSPVKLHIGRPNIHYLLYYALKCDNPSVM